MNTMNALLLGVVTLATVAVLVHGKGGTAILQAITQGITWGSKQVNGMSSKGSTP